jgi:hypothetical protein
MSVSAPLRFLALTLGGWVALRAAILVPDLWVEEGVAAPRAEGLAALPPSDGQARVGMGSQKKLFPEAPAPGTTRRIAAGAQLLTVPPRAALPATRTYAQREVPVAPVPPKVLPPAALPSAARVMGPEPLAAARSARRWSASIWMLARNEAGADVLAPGGTLGGGQAGIRFRYRLGGDTRAPLALSARLYLPLRTRSGAEAAAGLDWRPFARLPLNLLAERRQALGRDGRSAFSITAYGGYSGPVTRRLVLDAYGQAGVVGLRSRDAFFDGSVRLSVPLGRFELGAGAWAAAQPGIERFDIGPSVSMPIPAVGNTRLRADWRFRVAGDAAPASGPAVTLATDF